MNICKKKILITGADGFIGSHLTEMLVEQGASVKALSLYNSFNNWGWLEDIGCKDTIEVTTGDIRDPQFCREIVRGVDVVFHLAALIAIPYSYISPDSYVDTNVKGTLNICQAAREHKCERVIHISTSEVYGTANYVPIDEAHPLQPQSPYSASKIGADSMALSYYYSFKLPLVVARPFNTYGPRQSARAVIPTIISQLAAGEKSLKLGDLRPTRDFNYVKDVCRALILLLESTDSIGHVFNIGSHQEISIEILAQTIKKLMSSSTEIVSEQERLRPEASEVMRLWCDNSKIKDLVGYNPEYDLTSGLKETIEWFTAPENLKKYKTHLYNV